MAEIGSEFMNKLQSAYRVQRCVDRDGYYVDTRQFEALVEAVYQTGFHHGLWCPQPKVKLKDPNGFIHFGTVIVHNEHKDFEEGSG